MKILKFGGSSLANAQLMKRVGELVLGQGKIIVVLSAIQGTTDKLLEIIELVENYQLAEAEKEILSIHDFYLDYIKGLITDPVSLKEATGFVEDRFVFIKDFRPESATPTRKNEFSGQGEVLSTGIFEIYLRSVHGKSVYLNAVNFMRLDKENEPDQLYIRENLNILLDQFKDREIFVTQGYISKNYFGEITNLGRGGSDFTASIIGAAVDAEEIQIWSDTDGIQNNDPRVVPNTRPIAELSYKEAAEMAYFGAKVLHPKSVFPAQVQHIPVRLKNTLNPEAPGTTISVHSKKDKIKAIAAKDGIIAIRIRSAHMLMAYGFLKGIFEVFEEYKTPIDMISTSEVSVSLTIDSALNLEPILEKLKAFGEVTYDLDQTIICVIGDFLAEETGLASKVLQALTQIPIRMISYGGSKNNISLLVRSADKKQTLENLHKEVLEKQAAYV